MRALKILFIPLLLSLICCGKDKEPQSSQAILEIDPDLEEYGFSCDTISYKETRNFCLWQKNSFEKIRAIYEDSLKKIAPKCKECKECNIRERLGKLWGCELSLELALKVGIPYPTIDEKIKENEKMKAAFEERFGEPISDFELSIVSMMYRKSYGTALGYFYGDFKYMRSVEFLVFNPYANVIGKPEKHITRKQIVEEINMDDWFYFMLALQKWEKSYDKNSEGWLITIHYLDNEGYIDEFEPSVTYEERKISKNYPASIDEFIEFVEKLRIKTSEYGREPNKRTRKSE